MQTVLLDKERFEKIRDGEMTAWLVVDDEQVKAVDIGEIISFYNKDNEGEHIYARVRGYHVYGTFAELYRKVDKTALGYGKDETADPNDMLKIYSAEQEKKHGVKGFILKILPDFKTLDEMNEQEIEEYIKNIKKQADKQIKKQFDAMYGNAERIKFLIAYIERFPQFFDESLDFINRDMLKWSIRHDIKETQRLLAAIENCEKEHHLPMHPSGEPHK